jgi:hypothetical protein
MELQKAKDWVDLILKAMSIAAIIAAGVWALYQFKISDADAWNIQLTVTTEVLKYSKDSKILLIHARPKNIGKVPVVPEHLWVTVKDIPTGLNLGAIDLKNLKERYKADILSGYPDGYELEPGVEYDEIVALIVSNKGIYAATGEIDLDSENEIDQTIVTNVE